MLVGIPYENRAFLAYDLVTRRAYSQVYGGDAHRYRDVRRLSPFLLLGSDDVPRDADFRTLLDPESFGRPFPKAVEADQESPNPKVAALARRLWPDLRKRPPKAP